MRRIFGRRRNGTAEVKEFTYFIIDVFILRNRNEWCFNIRNTADHRLWDDNCHEFYYNGSFHFICRPDLYNGPAADTHTISREDHGCPDRRGYVRTTGGTDGLRDFIRCVQQKHMGGISDRVDRFHSDRMVFKTYFCKIRKLEKGGPEVKEERLEEVMEHFGGAVEKTVEGAANALDKSMNRAWSFGPVRLIGKALSFCAGAGLMASYFPLKEKGWHKAAKFCLISGGIIIIVQAAELLIFRKKN